MWKTPQFSDKFSDALNPDNGGLIVNNTLVEKGHKVVSVLKNSPADFAGIKTGWVLVKYNGKTPPADISRFGHLKDLFYTYFADPDGNFFSWDLPTWPFGITLSKPIDKVLFNKVATLQTNQENVLEYWKNNDLDAFTQLKDAFRKGLEKDVGIGSLGRLLGKHKTADLSQSSLPNYHGFLALGELQAGNIAEAQALLNICEKIRDNSEFGQSSYEIGMCMYVQSLVHVQQGDMEQAERFANFAHQIAPTVLPVRNLMWTFGEGPKSEAPDPLLGRKLPFDYTLPNLDPIGDMDTPHDIYELSEALANMQDNQMLAILVMGPYRANHYSNIDIAKLAAIHHAYPEIMSGLHVIVAGTRVPDESSRQVYERLANEWGIPPIILFDEDDKVASSLPHQGYPQRFLINKQGIVLSTKEFADETGIWEAYSNLTSA